MRKWTDTILKRIGIRECEHDFHVRTSGAMGKCSICRKFALIMKFTRRNCYG